MKSSMLRLAGSRIVLSNQNVRRRRPTQIRTPTVHRRLLVAGLILLLQYFSVAQSQEANVTLSNASDTTQGTIEYDLPTLSFRMMIEDQDVNVHQFQFELNYVVKLHLEKMLAGSLPADGDLDRQYLDQVELNLILDKTFQGVPNTDQPNDTNSTDSVTLPISLVRATFSDNKVRFLLPPGGLPNSGSTSAIHMEARLNFARAELKKLVIAALTGPAYRQFLRELQRSTVLNIIQTEDMAVVIDGQLMNGETPIVGPETDGGTDVSKPRRTLQIIGAVLFGLLGAVLIGAAGGVSYYYLDSKRNGLWNIHWKRTSETDAQNTSDTNSVQTNESSSWLDEWTKALTSIPLRSVNESGSKRSAGHRPRPMPRPAHQASGKSLLGCIPEYEDDEDEDGDDADTKGPIDVDELDDKQDVESGNVRREGEQFQDVDLASPEDYEPRVVTSMVYL